MTKDDYINVLEKQFDSIEDMVMSDLECIAPPRRDWIIRECVGLAFWKVLIKNNEITRYPSTIVFNELVDWFLEQSNKLKLFLL